MNLNKALLNLKVKFDNLSTRELKIIFMIVLITFYFFLILEMDGCVAYAEQIDQMNQVDTPDDKAEGENNLKNEKKDDERSAMRADENGGLWVHVLVSVSLFILIVYLR